MRLALIFARRASQRAANARLRAAAAAGVTRAIHLRAADAQQSSVHLFEEAARRQRVALDLVEEASALDGG